MTISYSSVGSSLAASGASPATISTTAALAAGDVLVVVMAYDNSGGGGADPLSNFAVTTASGTISSVSTQTGNNDTGAASAGLSARCNAYSVTSAITSGTNITVSWTGTVVVRAILLIKLTSSLSGGVVSYRNNSGATGANVAASAAPAFTTPTLFANEFVLCWFGYEYGANATGDSDTTNGTWGSIVTVNTGSTTSGMAAGVQGKTSTATATQTFNPTGTSSDWIFGAIVFEEVVNPLFAQAAYRFYADGTESGSTALAAQDTAYSPEVATGDVNLQLRLRVQMTNAGTTQNTLDDWQLQLEKNNSGTWTSLNVPADSYETSSGGTNLNFTSNVDRHAHSFTGNGGTLSRAEFYMHKVASPTATLTAYLYAHSGTFGTSSIPTGAPLATSTNTISAASLGASAWVGFNFDGSVTLTNGTRYCIAVGSSISSDASNYAGLQASTSLGHAGNRSTLVGSTWTASTVSDMKFRVYTTGSTVLGYDSTNLTDGAATTNRLTGGSGSFVAGKVSEDCNVEDFNWTASNYTELLYSLTLKSVDLADGDVLKFRVLYNGATTAMTYSVMPTINVVKTPPAITQAAYRFYADGTESGSTALAAQDTTTSVDISSGDVNLQLRMRLQSTSVADLQSTDDWQLQWEKNASGTWNNVATTVSESQLDVYSETNHGAQLNLQSTNLFAAGQSFIGDSKRLTRIDFWLAKNSSPTGTIRAYLYEHTGTYGSATTGKPTGTPLATATTVDISTLTASYGWVSFTFDGSYTLVGGTPYFAVVYFDEGGSGNALLVGVDSSSPTHSGNSATLLSGTWNSSGTDLCFRVFTTGEPVISFNSTNLTDAAATTNRLTGGSGGFLAGKVSEDGLVDDLGWTGNSFTEVLYSLTLKSSDLVNGDTLLFRVLLNGSTTYLTYSSYPTIIIAPPVPAITQAAYQFFATDSAESTGYKLSPLNDYLQVNTEFVDVACYLRVRLQSTNSNAIPSTDDFRLQFEKNSSGTWVDVTTTSTGGVKADPSSGITEGGSVTSNRLGIGSGTFVTGKISEDGLIDDFGWTGNNYTEVIYSIIVTASQVTSGDFFLFRILRNGATTEMTYSVTPRINVIETAMAISQTSYRFYADGTESGSTALAAQDTGYSADVTAGNLDLVARFRLQSTSAADPSSGTFTTSLQWESSTNPNVWTTASSGRVLTFFSASLTDAAATTNRLGSGSGSFNPGQVSEDYIVGAGQGGEHLGWRGNNYTEFVFTVRLVSASLTDGETIRLRLIRGGVSITYSVYPTLSIVKGVVTEDHIYLGDTLVSAMKLGDVNVSKAYLGDVQVFPAS